MQIKHIENEFSAYKVRAHALLQKKDAEITAARNSADIIAQQEAVRVRITFKFPKKIISFNNALFFSLGS